MKKFLFSIIILNFSFIISFAQGGQRPGSGSEFDPKNMPKEGIITGVIFDNETNKAVEYANIVLFSKRDSSMLTGTISDIEGKFKLIKLPYGKFYIAVDFIGYKKKIIKDININPQQKIINLGTIKLEQATKNISGVEIVAEKVYVEYKIDKKIINVDKDLFSASGSAIQVLENVPSVQVDIDGNVSLRGSSNFKVLIDGRPSVLSGSDALEQIPASTIENIELITNPSAKYDPEGIGGIINIILKKNKLKGFSGMVNLSAGTGDKYKGDIILSYRNKKFNVFAGINYHDKTSYGTGLTDMQRNINDTLNISDISMDRDMKRKGYSFKLGADYFITDKSVFTLEGSYGYHQFQRNHNSKNYYSTLPETNDVYSLSSFYPLRERYYYKMNLNYQYKFDNRGQELTAMMSYSSSDGGSDELQDEVITNADWIKTDEYISKINTTENENSNKYRIKLDYVKPFENKSRFETGLQSRIESEYEEYIFDEYDTTSNVWANNPLFNSDMNFDLNIYSAYATYSGNLFTIDYKLGLRGEYTDREISHKDTSDAYKIDRLDYFPTIHFSKQLNKTNQIMASYSRRIDRPRGWFLDPFTSYINAYNSRKGNPALEPVYIDSYEIAYQKKIKKSFVSLEGYYRKTKNRITRIRTLQDDGIVLHTFANINNDYSMGVELMANMEFYKWLRINASGNYYHYRIEGDIVEEDVEKESNNYDFRINTTFLIKKNTKFQLTTFYRGPSVTAQGKIKEFYSIDAAVRHDFLKNRASVSLNIRDIFGSRAHDFTTQELNLYTHTKFQREPAVVTLSLSYKINNYKAERNQRENGEGMQMEDDI